MVSIRPWNKKAEKVFWELSRNGQSCITDIGFSRTFGREYKKIIDPPNDFIDIARTEKKQRTWVVKTPNTMVVPEPPGPFKPSKFMKFKFYKIF